MNKGQVWRVNTKISAETLTLGISFLRLFPLLYVDLSTNQASKFQTLFNQMQLSRRPSSAYVMAPA